jgi:hypothetical protein
MNSPKLYEAEERFGQEMQKILEKNYKGICEYYLQASGELSDLFSQELQRCKEEAYNRFFLEIDKEFESFKITEAMGKILQRLKKESHENPMH